MNAAAADSGWKKTFFLIWSGQAASLLGSQVVHFAVAWWITRTTGSAVVLATIAIFGMLPQVLLGPFIGALVDRWNRRTVMIVTDTTIAALTLILAALFFTGQVQFWHLYALALLRSTLGVFHWTAMQASTSLMVPKEQLSRVAGLNQTLQGILTIAAPPLGALLVEFLAMGPIMLVDVATAGLAVLPLLFARIPQPEKTSTEPVTPRAVLADVVEGFRYLRAFPGMLIILGMAMLINFLLSPTGTLTPLLVTRHFAGGPWHLSAMESAWGFGVIAGGLLLAAWGGFKKRVVTSMVFIMGISLSAWLTGFAPSGLFWMAVLGNGLAGFTNPLVNGPLFALMQEKIAPEMQGRVFTLVGSLSGAIAPLGLALAAPVADHLGVQVWWILGGAVCLVMGAAGLFIPAVRNIEADMTAAGAAAATAAAPLAAPAE